MQTTIDPVFGELNYSHSWKGVCHVPDFGSIPIIVQAYPGEGVSENQRESFRKFMEDSGHFMADATGALAAYLKKTYPDANPTDFRPEYIIFQQSGVWGFAYPAPNDEDDGLSVRFENNQIIADTEDSLL